MVTVVRFEIENSLGRRGRIKLRQIIKKDKPARQNQLEYRHIISVLLSCAIFSSCWSLFLGLVAKHAVSSMCSVSAHI